MATNRKAGDSPTGTRSSIPCPAAEPGLDHVWERIEAWLAANAPAKAGGFNPPASPRELAKTERVLGVQFPEDVRRSYLRHNGQSTEVSSMLVEWEWYSLDRVRSDWKMWKGLLDGGVFAGSRSDTDGLRIRKGDWWNPAWVPLACFEGDTLFLDLAPGPQGRVGQIIVMWQQCAQRLWGAASFTDYLALIADEMEAGRVAVHKDLGDALDRIEWLWATLVRRGGWRKMEAWPVVLNLARQFGWEPAGTRPPRGVRVADWDATDYITLARQQVTKADALALAAALGRALAAIPKGDRAERPEDASSELAFFTGYNRRELADFAKYCKRGAFRITEDHPDA
jgi:cell wall assembly regulator SMI1